MVGGKCFGGLVKVEVSEVVGFIGFGFFFK